MILDLAAVCLLRGRTCLNVRKRGTNHLILPGGKIEPGETALAAALRETREEVGLRLQADRVRELGCFTAAAANRDAEAVRCVVHTADWQPEWPDPRPDNEIVEIEWTDLDTCGDDPRSAPLLVEAVLPALRSAGLL